MAEMRKPTEDDARRLADKGAAEAGRMAREVQAANGVDPKLTMGVQDGRRRAAAAGAGGGPTNVDLRHSIIHDGRELSDRLVRENAGVTGAF